MLRHEIHSALDVQVYADARAHLERGGDIVDSIEVASKDLSHDRGGAVATESFGRGGSDGSHVAGLSATLGEEDCQVRGSPSASLLLPAGSGRRTSIQQLDLPFIHNLLHRNSLPLLPLDHRSRWTLVAPNDFRHQGRQQGIALAS